SHRRIYARMMELQERGRAVDIITLSEELSKKKEVEAVGGIAYLASLTDGLPRRPSIEQYIRIVKDKALLRGVIFACNAGIEQASEQAESALDVISTVESTIHHLQADATKGEVKHVGEISNYWLDELHRPNDGEMLGLASGIERLDKLTNGFRPGQLII